MQNRESAEKLLDGAVQLDSQKLECQGFLNPSHVSDLFQWNGELKQDLATLVWMHLFYRLDMTDAQPVDLCATFVANEELVATYLRTLDESMITDDYKQFQTRQSMQPDSEEAIEFPVLERALVAAYPPTTEEELDALQILGSFLIQDGNSKQDLETVGLSDFYFPYIHKLTVSSAS